MKLVKVKINSKVYKFQVENNYQNYLELIDSIKDTDDLNFTAYKVVTLKPFNYFTIPARSSLYNKWAEVIYRNILTDIGYSNNAISLIISNKKDIKSTKPKRDFTTAQKAFGLIKSESERVSRIYER